jgi:hypothetical protein
MKLSMKKLSTGYWHARDENAAHLFAQFQFFPCGASDVSHNWANEDTVLRFIQAVNAAGAAMLTAAPGEGKS